MTTGDALLKAILRDPADDTARLVYADWLEENGQAERAEFIRLQIACASVQTDKNGYPLYGHGGDDGCEACKPFDRIEEILKHLGSDAWGGWGDKGIPVSIDQGRVVRRGFVESVRCSPADWAAHAAAVRACQPVTRVTFTQRPFYHTTNHRKTEGFDPVVRRRIIRESWDAYFVVPVYTTRPDRMAVENAIDSCEIMIDKTGGIIHVYRELFDKKVARLRTLDGYLGYKWKGIEFEYPGRRHALRIGQVVCLDRHGRLSPEGGPNPNVGYVHLLDPDGVHAHIHYGSAMSISDRLEIGLASPDPDSHGGQYRHWLSEPEPGDAWADPS